LRATPSIKTAATARWPRPAELPVEPPARSGGKTLPIRGGVTRFRDARVAGMSGRVRHVVWAPTCFAATLKNLAQA